MTKPISIGQALQITKLNRLSFTHGMIDLDRGEVVYRNNHRCPLSPREVQVLMYLIHRPGFPVSRDELLTHVWKVDPARTQTRTIDMHISQLRRKLKDKGRKSALLLTVNGCGYMFAPGSIHQQE